MTGYTLTNPPENERDRELWMQHAAGHIIFHNIRRYAMRKIPQDLDDATKEKIIDGIDNTIYGYMMMLDGAFEPFTNDSYEVSIDTKIVLSKNDGEIVHAIDTLEGDGMCMGYHGWMEGDFGEVPIYEE
jgi:hypothetical protein